MINVTVEADAFCGYGLTLKAQQAGVIYSMAYGDQPALACDLVDWARTCGFNVVAAGRGHKWHRIIANLPRILSGITGG